MELDRHHEVVVIGNGVVGSSISFELSRRGIDVARIGEPNSTYAASVASGAMLGCFGEVTTSLLASESGTAKLAIDYEARGMWPDWVTALGEASGDQTPLFTSRGTLVILNSTGSMAVDHGNFRAIESALKTYDEPYELVDPQDHDWLTPNDLHRSMQGIYIPAEHSVNSAALLRKLDDAISRTSGTLIDGLVHGLLTDGDRVVGVVLDDGSTVGADALVIAAGARSTALLEAFQDISRRVPFLVSGYGVSVLVETSDRTLPDSVIRTPNRSFACGLHCVPRGDGVLYIGATNIVSHEPRQHALLSDVKFLFDCALDQLHTSFDDASLLKLQVGNRPVSADGFPLFGKVEGTANLWMASGTSRDGLHQSPLLAQQLADMMGGKAAHPLLRDFTPVRPPLPSGTRSDVVAEAVEHMLGSGWEAKWNVGREWPVILEHNLREGYRRIAESLHPTFTPTAPLLAEMDDVLDESSRDPLRRALASYYEEWTE